MSEKIKSVVIFTVTALLMTTAYIPSSHGSPTLKVPSEVRVKNRLGLLRSGKTSGTRLSRVRNPIYSDQQIYSFSDFQESMMNVPGVPIEKFTDFGSLKF